jgi:hypothetical protein
MKAKSTKAIVHWGSPGSEVSARASRNGNREKLKASSSREKEKKMDGIQEFVDLTTESSAPAKSREHVSEESNCKTENADALPPVSPLCRQCNPRVLMRLVSSRKRGHYYYECTTCEDFMWPEDAKEHLPSGPICLCGYASYATTCEESGEVWACAKMDGAPCSFLQPSDSPGSEAVSLGATQLKPNAADTVADTKYLDGAETMQSVSSLVQVSYPATSAPSQTTKKLNAPDAYQFQSKKKAPCWADLSEYDWRDILYSLADVPRFGLHLPKEHRFVRRSLDDYRRTWGISNQQPALLELFDPKTREPADNYASSSSVLCDHPKNPEHWGHILWRFIADLKEL